MKKFFFTIGLYLILHLPTNIYAEKVAIINVSDVFHNIVTNKAIFKQLEKEFKERADELQNMEKDLQIQSEKLQKNVFNKPIHPNEKDLKVFESKRAYFLKKAQQFEQDNQYRQQEERNKILQTIKTVTKSIAEKECYDLVIDMNSIFYVKDESKLKNITDFVIKKVK
ncbi:MAG: OmpH family outer membrane protein [Arsenophonus sp.]